MSFVRKVRSWVSGALIVTSSAIFVSCFDSLRTWPDCGMDTPCYSPLAVTRVVEERWIKGAVDNVPRSSLIVQVLEDIPLAGRGWLELASTLFFEGSNSGSIAAAIALSRLTNPNEVDVMAGRGLLVFSIWAKLPVATQRDAVIDFVNGGWDYLLPAQRDFLRQGLVNQPPAIKVEIKTALLLAGDNGMKIVAYLGL